MTNIEPTVDLGAVQWSTELRRHFDAVLGGGGTIDAWHVVGVEDQPDGYGEVVYDLRVERATDTNGNDLSAVVAEAIARRLNGS